MKRYWILPGQQKKRFRFRPSFCAPREDLKRYIADVSAIVFGYGMTRRQARRLAFRLLASTGERPQLPPFLPPDEVKQELMELVNAFGKSHPSE